MTEAETKSALDPMMVAGSWTCFHCDETFTDEASARDHFGADEGCDAACRIKFGAERSMLKALRRAEKDASDAWMAIHNETTDAARAYYAASARHQEQLRIAEELGYERGVEDGRAMQEAMLAQGGGEVRPDTHWARLVKRLLNPPFGTDTSERLLMGEAADAVRYLLERVSPASEALMAEVAAWRECALYDPTMEGPRFKGWDRSALDRCRVAAEKVRANTERQP